MSLRMSAIEQPSAAKLWKIIAMCAMLLTNRNLEFFHLFIQDGCVFGVGAKKLPTKEGADNFSSNWSRLFFKGIVEIPFHELDARGEQKEQLNFQLSWGLTLPKPKLWALTRV